MYIIVIHFFIMVKLRNVLKNCVGFEWDQGNSTKNWDKHNVSKKESEQIFFNKPSIIKRNKKHSLLENRYYALGKTDLNRLLFAVFTIRHEKIRIISVRDMSNTEIKRYLS